MKKLKLFFACLLMAVLSIGQVWAATQTGSITFDFEDDGAHRASGSNSYAEGPQSYSENSVNISCSYMDIVTTGTPLNGSANALGRVAKNKTTSPVLLIGPIDLTDKTITEITYYTKGVATLSQVCEYSTNGSSWTKAVESFNLSTTSTQKSSGTISVAGTSTFYVRITTSVSSSTTSNRDLQIDDVVISYSYEDSGTPTCVAPTFSPAAGAVVSGTTVALSTTTDEATIHYTMGANPADPTESDATYSTPIEITEATTIKAIAVKGGMNNSGVASASYTVVEPLTTMDAIFAAATTAGDTPADVYITFNNWVVSGVKNNTAYVTDGTKGFIIYYSGHGFEAGDILSGTASFKLKLYNGAAEITAKNSGTVSVAKGGSVSPVVLDAEGIAALTGANTGSVIKISGECTYESSKYYIAGVQLYNQLYSFSVSAGTNYECTGVYVLNTSYGKEILPRSAADIVAQTSVANPTFNPAAGEYTAAQSVELSCATAGSTIYYTTDGSTPDNTSTAYSSAIEVAASMTIKAIAYKGDDHSEVATAIYTINIPIPAHDFDFVHEFTTGAGFEFPDGWTNSYAEHEIAFTDDKVVFAAASKQSAGSTIEDCPVTKNQAISLVLTNSAKLISAVRFDYKQWGTKAQTLTMQYSTDGGSTYNAFDPAVSSANFALQVLNLPEGTNAIQVIGSNSSNQVGLVRISFDLEDKPIVTKTVTITTPSNGTLVVKNGNDPISSGDAIEVGTPLTIIATPNTDYSLDAISVVDEDDAPITVTEGVFEVPNKNVTVSATFVEDARPAASLKLMENGNEVAFPGDHKQNDHVTLPTTVSQECAGRVFVGWSAVEVAQTDVKPSYNEPGADFVLSAAGENILYAVYAVQGAATSNYKISAQAPADGETVIVARLVESTYYAMTNAATPASSELTLTVGVVESPADAVLWDVEDATEGVYLRPTGTTDGLHMNSSALKVANGDTNGDIKFTSNGDGSFKATRADDARWIVVSGTNGLSCSATEANAAALYIFKAIHNYSKYSTTCDAAIDAPEFTPAEGTYTSAQNITISAATGATIYYTTDGTDPTKESSVYSAAIPLNEAGTTTIKAFAVKGEAESDIASATYTINLPLTTMDQIFAKANAVGTTATDVTIVFGNWVVSSISTNGKQVYLTDGSKGLVIFDNGGSLGFSVGDILSGTVDCKLQKYNGFSEVTTLTSSSTGLTVTTGGVITPIATSIDALSGVNTGAPIVVSNVKFDGTNLVDASDNEIQPYTTLYAAAVTSLTTNKYYNVTGIYTQFNSKKEILPRSADDIEELTQEAPTMTWYTSDAKTQTIAANAKYSIDLGDDFAPVFETNSTGDLTYSSSNTTVAEINETTGALTLKGVEGETTITCAVAADGNYTAGSQGFILKVRESAPVDNVVILAQYNGTWYAMKNTGVTSKAAAALEVVYSDGKVWNLSAEDQAAIKWKRTVDGEGNVTFQAPNDDYLKTTTGNDLSQEAGESGVYQWTWNDTYYRTGSNTRTFLYRNGYNFRYYAVSNASAAGYSALPIIVAAEFAEGDAYIEVRSGLTINNYYTVCLPKQVTDVKGASIWNVLSKAENGKDVILEEETGILEAGRPYFFYATADKLEVVYDGDAVSSPVNDDANGLIGSFSQVKIAQSPNNYIIYNNELYYVNSNNVYVGANRAYLDMTGVPAYSSANLAPGRRRVTMAVHGENAAQGIEDVQGDNVQSTKVLINGNLYILCGEKVYDATGRLVK